MRAPHPRGSGGALIPDHVIAEGVSSDAMLPREIPVRSCAPRSPGAGRSCLGASTFSHGSPAASCLLLLSSLLRIACCPQACGEPVDKSWDGTFEV